MSYRSFERCKSDTYTHTRARALTHTSTRQLKIPFLDVLDYSEYSDTNILKKKKKKKISRKHSFLSEDAKLMKNKNGLTQDRVFWKIGLRKKNKKKSFDLTFEQPVYNILFWISQRITADWKVY